MRRDEGRISKLLISFLLAGSFLLPGVASAQTQTTGAITGRLTDIGGAVIAGGGSGDCNDSNDRHQRWGPAGFDRTNRVALAYRWELPLLHDGNFMLRQAVNGWAVSGVTTIQSGDRLTITDSLGGSIYGSVSTSRAQLCPGVLNSQIETRGSLRSRLTNYFNTSAFCPAPALDGGTGYGNSSAGVVRGPEQNNTDLTLSRIFKLGSSEKRTWTSEVSFSTHSITCSMPIQQWPTARRALAPSKAPPWPRVLFS